MFHGPSNVCKFLLFSGTCIASNLHHQMRLSWGRGACRYIVVHQRPTVGIGRVNLVDLVHFSIPWGAPQVGSRSIANGQIMSPQGLRSLRGRRFSKWVLLGRGHWCVGRS